MFRPGKDRTAVSQLQALLLNCAVHRGWLKGFAGTFRQLLAQGAHDLDNLHRSSEFLKLSED